MLGPRRPTPDDILLKTRAEISLAFKVVLNGLEPYSWQLDVCKVLLLGLGRIPMSKGLERPVIYEALAASSGFQVLVRTDLLQHMRIGSEGIHAPPDASPEGSTT